MTDFDAFAVQLLEEAKRFLEKAKEVEDPTAEAAYLHAALMLSFCALEAQVNSIGEEFSIRTDISAHERGLILERDVKLEKGEFRLQSSLKSKRSVWAVWTGLILAGILPSGHSGWVHLEDRWMLAMLQ